VLSRFGVGGGERGHSTLLEEKVTVHKGRERKGSQVGILLRKTIECDGASGDDRG